jgi:hypothetical protein
MLQIEIEKLPSFILGQKKGEQKKAVMIAKQLIKKNVPTADILEITGLDASELPTIDEKQ